MLSIKPEARGNYITICPYTTSVGHKLLPILTPNYKLTPYKFMMVPVYMRLILWSRMPIK